MRIRVPPAVAARVAGAVVGTLARTWRVEHRHRERFDVARAAGEPMVVLLWHECLLPLLWDHRHLEVAIVVSEAVDGRYLAGYAERLGYRTIAGSSTRGGHQALRGMLKHLRGGGLVAVTPDGPVGPRREVKPGALIAAQRTGAIVVAAQVVARRAWRLRSWDRFMVPRPFSELRIGYGPARRVGPGPEGTEDAVRVIRGDLDSLEQELLWHGVAAPIA